MRAALVLAAVIAISGLTVVALTSRGGDSVTSQQDSVDTGASSSSQASTTDSAPPPPPEVYITGDPTATTGSASDGVEITYAITGTKAPGYIINVTYTDASGALVTC